MCVGSNGRSSRRSRVRDAVREPDERIRIAVRRRQLRDALGVNHAAERRLRRLEDRRRRGHVHGLFGSADLERDVEIDAIVDVQLDPVAGERLEPGELDDDLVGARNQVGRLKQP